MSLHTPTSHFYHSQGLRLHYADWGNGAGAPLIILVHGGRDHCRSWDTLARTLQPHFHVIAPDLRGHGDSDWAKGSSYSISDYVYDLMRLIHSAGLRKPSIIGHSMGGMISLMFAGAFPDDVSRLAILDGVTVRQDPPRAPIHELIAAWVAQLDQISQHKRRTFRTIAEAADRISAHNKRLMPEQALHLAAHGVRQNADGSYSWKYDEYQKARAPYRLALDDYAALFARITCPTLLLHGSESFLKDPQMTGMLAHFRTAQFETIAGAGHWLQHDKPDAVLRALREFLGTVA
jgi:pimeloyl-ACP methyl ester carboxylesterase